MSVILLHTRPHVEASGCHANRFDAFLPDGELIHTGAQILRPAARKLIERGYDPSTMLTMQMEGAERPSFAPRPIGALAGEVMAETDRDGFVVQRWKAPPSTRPPSNLAQVGGGPMDEEAA